MQKVFLSRFLLFYIFIGWNICFAQHQSAIFLDSILSPGNSILDNFPDSVFAIAEKSYRSGNNDEKVKALLIIGKVNLINGNYLAAQQALQEGLLILKSIDQQKIHGDFYQSVGKLFNLKRHYVESLNYYQMAILVYEQLNLTDEMAFSKLGIVELFRKLKEYGKAEHLLMEIKEQIQPSTSNYVWAEYYNRKAAIFNEKNVATKVISYSDSSMKYTLLALEVAEKMDNKHLIATSLNELGYNYENQQNFKSAYEYYSRAEKIWEELNYQRYNCHVKNNIGRILFKQMRYAASIEKIMERLSLTEKNDWKDIMVYSYYYLANNYEQLNDFRHAAGYWRKYAEQSIITMEEEKSNALKEVETKYELKEKEKLMLAKRNTEKTTGQEKQYYWVPALISILIVIVLFLKRKKLMSYLGG